MLRLTRPSERQLSLSEGACHLPERNAEYGNRLQTNEALSNNRCAYGKEDYSEPGHSTSGATDCDCNSRSDANRNSIEELMPIVVSIILDDVCFQVEDVCYGERFRRECAE